MTGHNSHTPSRLQHLAKIKLLLIAASAAQAQTTPSTPSHWTYSYGDYGDYGDYGNVEDQCATGCFSAWLNDGVCDAECNNAACNYDGRDCFHNATECYTAADGKDYRGRRNTTLSGRACQVWSQDEPWHHTKTTFDYPDSGLGGHNFCRNPDGEPGPWCYTMDFPNKRFELCDVGLPSPSCAGASPASTLPVATPVSPNVTALTLSTPVHGRARESVKKFYEARVWPNMTGVRVSLLPTSGDADLALSFTEQKPELNTATWVDQSAGAKVWSLPSSSSYYCRPADARPVSLEGSDATPHHGLPAPTSFDNCKLYITVIGYETGNFTLTYYNSSAATDGPAASGPTSCSPGCDELKVGDGVCDQQCNTSACYYDLGDCASGAGTGVERSCAKGCNVDWLGDDFCDESCFNAACEWDKGDCSVPVGCSDGCLPEWLDDKECDIECNTANCGYDGSDCDHSASECYKRPDGADYRGSVSTTRSGYTCQVWQEQEPHSHTRTHRLHPDDGLGGHNHCRNPMWLPSLEPGEEPRAEEDGPWCYTTNPLVRFELCNVPGPQDDCTALESQDPLAYHTLCPVDCALLLGNGHCDLRCNISSCVYDRGDCGVGIDFALAAVGYIKRTALKEYYMSILVTGVIIGVLVGLGLLRCVIMKIKSDQKARRGYSDDELKGVGVYEMNDLE